MENVREKLSPEAQILFDDIVTQRVLGASAHIKMICDMFKDVCEHAAGSAEEAAEDIMCVADYFTATRGESSQAISTAICELTNGISPKNGLAELRKLVHQNIDLFEQKNRLNLDRINQYAVSLMGVMQSVMLFDYSSTVGRMVESCAESGKTYDLYIPESRALNGGKPYIKPCIRGKCRVHFIPDAAIYYYLKKCDGAFIGAETFYPDGRVFNTVGSEMVAALCRQMDIPFYVLTTLIKMDRRALFGYQKPQLMLDLKDRMAIGFEEQEGDYTDFSCPEIVEVLPEYITAFVTEEGIVPPSAMFYLCDRYAKECGR